MPQLDRKAAQGLALVIDGNPTSRSVVVQHLRDFGFGTLRQAGRVAEAREMLEQQPFDLVICDEHFDGDQPSGLDLLEELRQEQLLPYGTVFVMVTGAATYQKVAEAAESALDSYLVKPFSANTLFERLKEARQRKRELGPVFDAIDRGDPVHAAALCVVRFTKRQLYWLYAARLGAELLLNLKRHAEARRLFDAVIAAQPLPWARLGVARVQLAEGKPTQARRTLAPLIEEDPRYADAHDVLARVQLEQGQLAEALATCCSAAAITPGCLLRLQHHGTLSFYGGDTATARQMLERAWGLGNRSRLLDVLSLALLALIAFDARDARAVEQAREAMQRFAAAHPQSLRLRRMATLGEALVCLLAGPAAQGLARARAMTEEIAHAGFDMEAATNVLSLWVRLGPFGVPQEEIREVVQRITRRFAVSRLATEILVAAARHDAEAVRWVHEAQATLLQCAESAMEGAVAGEPRAAVEGLLQRGQESGNAKLIEMAALVAKRHRDHIEGVDSLIETAAELARHYCVPITHIAGMRRSHRPPGGLLLRPAAAPTAPKAGVSAAAFAGPAGAAAPIGPAQAHPQDQAQAKAHEARLRTAAPAPPGAATA